MLSKRCIKEIDILHIHKKGIESFLIKTDFVSHFYIKRFYKIFVEF